MQGQLQSDNSQVDLSSLGNSDDQLRVTRFLCNAKRQFSVHRDNRDLQPKHLEGGGGSFSCSRSNEHCAIRYSEIYFAARSKDVVQFPSTSVPPSATRECCLVTPSLCPVRQPHPFSPLTLRIAFPLHACTRAATAFVFFRWVATGCLLRCYAVLETRLGKLPRACRLPG